MAEEGARFTAFGKILSLALIVALVGGGGYMVYSKLGKGDPKPDVNATHKPPLHEAEATDPGNVTTVKKYEYIAADRLPPVKGVGNYKWDNNNKVVRFSYNVWSGWLPVFAANGGAKPNPNSVFAKKYGFQVELVKMDDPIMAREAFAMGEIHTLWGTADMFVLFAPALQKDSRSRPRIVQQIDWSNGGDGIVVRSSIKSVSDLKGKTIAYAPNSPSEYYLTSLLLSAGMRPSDIKAKHTATAFEAAAAFVADKSVDACVSWAPDIYTIPEKVPNTKILSSTADANKLIADVYAVRADFAKEHPEIVEGLVAGIFEGMDMLKQDPKPAYAAMAAEFNMKPEEIAAMRNDAHPTNFAENVQFFLNASNPTNFERTWKNATTSTLSWAASNQGRYRRRSTP